LSDATLLARAQAWRQSQDWQTAGWSSGQAFQAAERTARWVATLGLDQTTQAACLLYPVALQTAVSDKALIGQWGEEVVFLLKGFDRLASMRGQLGSGVHPPAESASARQGQIETLRRMILALSDDIRVVIARLAFHQVRLEDMAQALRQTTDLTLSEQALQLGQETMLVQAPLANRLGIWQLKWAMEDLAFRFTQPQVYKQIAGWLDEKRGEREAFVERTIRALSDLMQEAGLTAQVAGRPKHLYSIYNKMRQKALAFDDLRDLRAFRILVSTQAECYEALAQLHAAYRPMSDEFDDYIVRPKPNGYQSLHTVLLDEQSRPFEVQIRTHDMHLRAEYGVAAHWRYKETGGSAPAPSGPGTAGSQAGHAQQIQWLRQMLDWGQAVGQVRLSSDRIYVLTPQARIVELAAGATALDFAYALHTELGHRCRGAKADGQIITLQTPLVTGQTVELLTVKQGVPSRDWLQPELGYLKTNRARSKVRAYFNALEADEKSDAAQAAGLVSTAAQTEEALAAHEQEVEQTLMARVQRSRPTAGKGQVLVVGVDRMLTHFAKCCRPLPPDPIIGFVTRGRGVTVHRAQCPTLARMVQAQPDRVIETSWGQPSSGSVGSGATYAVGITLRADRRDGFMRLLTETLIKERVSLGQMTTHQTGESLSLSAEIQVESSAQLEHCLTALRGLPGVRSVVRD
jgi:GTP pyrophosphokinase